MKMLTENIKSMRAKNVSVLSKRLEHLFHNNLKTTLDDVPILISYKRNSRQEINELKKIIV